MSGTNHQSFSGYCELNEVLHDLRILADAEYLRRKGLYCGNVAPAVDVHRLLAQYVIAFLHTALAGDPGLDYYLTPGWALTREPLAKVFRTEKRNPNAAADECLAGPTEANQRVHRGEVRILDECGDTRRLEQPLGHPSLSWKQVLAEQHVPITGHRGARHRAVQECASFPSGPRTNRVLTAINRLFIFLA